MRVDQIIKRIYASTYTELVNQIQALLDEMNPNFRCVKIDYFRMQDDDPGDAVAILLFENVSCKND